MCNDHRNTIRITNDTSCTAWLGGCYQVLECDTLNKKSSVTKITNYLFQSSVNCHLTSTEWNMESSICPNTLKLNFSKMLRLVFLALLSMLETNARAAEDVTCSDIGNTVMSENEMVLSHGDREEKVPLDLDARVWTVTPGVTVLSSDR